MKRFVYGLLVGGLSLLVMSCGATAEPADSGTTAPASSAPAPSTPAPTAPASSAPAVSTPAPSAPAPSAPTPSAPAPSAPKSGGTFNVPVTADPNDFDMSYTGSSNTNGSFNRYGYSSVLRLQTGPEIGYGQQVVAANLADKWEVSPDAKSFTLILRDGLKFHDVPPVNGRALTSADVKWSYRYMARVDEFKDLTRGQFRWMFEGLDEILTPDPKTVVVKFKDSFAPFLTYAASSDNVVMAKEVFETEGHFKDTLIGSGPLITDIANSQQGSRWVFKKNPTYHEDGKPYVDEVRLLVIQDTATRQAAFQAKQVDLYLAASDALAWEEARRSVPNAIEYEYIGAPQNLYTHTKRPPFDNFKVREALSLAFNRDEIIKVVAAGKGEWALSMSNLRTDLFTQEEIKSFIKYDPEAAKKALTEAGYPDGFSIEFMYNDGGNEAYKKTAELIQAQMKKVGINFEFDVVSAADYTKRRRARDFNIKLTGESTRTDLDAFFHLYVHPAGAFNYIDADIPKANELIAAQRRETDPVKRREILRELLRFLNEEFYWLTTFRTNQIIFMQPYVKDHYHNADYRTVGWVADVWLDK